MPVRRAKRAPGGRSTFEATQVRKDPSDGLISRRRSQFWFTQADKRSRVCLPLVKICLAGPVAIVVVKGDVEDTLV